MVTDQRLDFTRPSFLVVCLNVGLAGESQVIIAGFCPPPKAKSILRTVRKGAAKVFKRECFTKKVNRLKNEMEVAEQHHAHVLFPVSRKELKARFTKVNHPDPRIVVVSGHHDQDKRRLVGFGEEKGFNEISAKGFAELIIGSAAQGARNRD